MEMVRRESRPNPERTRHQPHQYQSLTPSQHSSASLGITSTSEKSLTGIKMRAKSEKAQTKSEKSAGEIGKNRRQQSLVSQTQTQTRALHTLQASMRACTSLLHGTTCTTRAQRGNNRACIVGIARYVRVWRRKDEGAGGIVVHEPVCAHQIAQARNAARGQGEGATRPHLAESIQGHRQGHPPARLSLWRLWRRKMGLRRRRRVGRCGPPFLTTSTPPPPHTHT